MIIAFVSMFISTFLSGFRSRSIASDFKIQASVSGALQTGGELLAVVALVKSPTVDVIVAASVAAGLGYYLSMVVHNQINKGYYKRKKKEHKEWVDRRIERRFKRLSKLKDEA